MSSSPFRVACVGGSITFGLGLANRREESYPSLLQELLGEEFHVRNFGYAGAAVGERTNEPYTGTPTFTSATRFDPQLVLIMLGTNDAQHANADALPEFEDGLHELIDRFEQLPTGPQVILMTPPPVLEPIDEINVATLDDVIRPAVERAAALRGLTLLDAYSPFLGRPEWLPDKLHPTLEGARALSALTAPAVRAAAAGG